MRVRWLLPAVLLAALAIACVPDPGEPPQPAGRIGRRGAADAAADARRPDPDPLVRPPDADPEPTFALYTVKRGDTLVGIAKRFKTDGRSIAYWNRVTYPSLDPDSTKYQPDRHRGRLGPADPAGRDGRSRGAPRADAQADAAADAAAAIGQPQPGHLTRTRRAPGATSAVSGLAWTGPSAASSRIVVTVADPATVERSRPRGPQERALCRRGPERRRRPDPRHGGRGRVRTRRGARVDGRAAAERRRRRGPGPLRAREPGRGGDRAGARRARTRGLDRRERPGRADPRRLPRDAGDQRVLGWDAHPERRGARRPGLERSVPRRPIRSAWRRAAG